MPQLLSESHLFQSYLLLEFPAEHPLPLGSTLLVYLGNRDIASDRLRSAHIPRERKCTLDSKDISESRYHNV